MASLLNSLFCAGAALLIYSGLGLPLTLRIAPRPLALMLAPALGWAVHSALALPLFFLIGLSRPSVALVIAVPLLVALAVLAQDRVWRGEALLGHVTAMALAGALLLAFIVMAAVLPKVTPDGIALAGPVFDHSKIAMIDEMARLGVPPGNPFFGGEGAPAHLSYYYLWHFSAAEWALLTGVSGWEADAGLSFFTAVASLSMLAGFAVWLSGRAGAALWVVALAATASLRPLIYALFGIDRTEAIIGYQSGFGGWLFQTSWAPQHTASAMAALLSVYLLVEVCKRPGAHNVLLLALSMAASFESSTWVGGIALPLAAMPAALALLMRADKQQRLRLVVALGLAALLALLLIAPMLHDQVQMTALRGDGAPIKFEPTEIFSDGISDRFGVWVNWPAFWLIYLPVEFPAFYGTGLVGLYVLSKDRALTAGRRAVILAFALTLAASLVASWLLVSTLGDNNDLGWRAVLPGIMLLIVFAAVFLSRLSLRPLSAAPVVAILLLLLGLPDAVKLARSNFAGTPDAQAKTFAASPSLWQAVRRVTPADERIANNPNYLDRVTPWGVNISWALLSGRRSCYASPALVGPFSALSKAREAEIGAQFVRVFSGRALPGDVEALVTQYKCDTAVVTPDDGAWAADPFAASARYRLADGNAQWRIYRAVKP
ncbi:MAG: hypothetical protein WCG00_13220 [Hyphomicrobiales bacterium]